MLIQDPTFIRTLRVREMHQIWRILAILTKVQVEICGYYLRAARNNDFTVIIFVTNH